MNAALERQEGLEPCLCQRVVLTAIAMSAAPPGAAASEAGSPALWVILLRPPQLLPLP